METNDYYSRDLEEHVCIEIKPEYQVFVDLMRVYVESWEEHNRIPFFDDSSYLEESIASLYLNDEVRLLKDIADAKRDFLLNYNCLSFEEQMELNEYLLTIFSENELFFIKRAEYSH